MKFAFDVGIQENHRIACSFSQYSGKAEITVDGAPVTQKFELAQVKLTKRYEIKVGTQEAHTVAIERKRPIFLPLFRPQEYRVLVDGQLIETYKGY